MTANDEHPLVRHIHSLATALDSHHAQIHHHALTAHRAHSHSTLLSRQISILEQELSTLHTPPQSTESALKINQLTLALRTVNEKLDATERLLLERTRQLDHARADASAAKASMDAAYDLAARLHAQVEASHTKLRMEQEKVRMSERVIQDYADLVRKLEGRRPSIPTRNIEQRDSTSETPNLQHELSVLQTRLDAQIQTNADLTSQLSHLQVELDKRDRDDNTASKMVSRYMKFSQQSTNALQTTLTSLQHRHASTLTSYTSQIHLLQHHLQTLTASQHHLDDLRYHLSKEHFGRRWETRLRLQLVRREERLVEDLKRWLRRSEERLMVGGEGDLKTCLMEMIQDAKIVVDRVDTPIHVDTHDQQPISGSLARIIMMQSTVLDLLDRLQWEQERRLDLEEWVGRRDGGVKESVSIQGENDLSQDVSPLEPITDVYGERVYPVHTSPACSQSDNTIVEPEEGGVALVEQVEEVVVEQNTDQSEQEADTSPTDATSSSPPPPPPPPHPLLKPLHNSRNRYTHIQNSFHACHIALEHLKSSLNNSPTRPVDTTLPCGALRTIVQRLDDWTEDVRVEVEMRVLDEGVLGRGYETLLVCASNGKDGEGGEGWDEEEVLAFVSGTDPGIVRAVEGFERKLRDLEGDVAVLKKVVYSFGHDDEEEDGREEEETRESISTDTLVASPTPGRWISSWISPSTPPSQQASSTNSILRRTASSLGFAPSPSSHNNNMVHAKMSPGEVIKHLHLKTPMPDLELIQSAFESGDGQQEKDGRDHGHGHAPGLIPAFSRFGSPGVVTGVTPRMRASFAVGMGVVGGRRGGGGRGGMVGEVGRRGGVFDVESTGGVMGSEEMGEGEDVD